MELATVLVCLSVLIVSGLFWVIINQPKPRATWRNAYKPTLPSSLEAMPNAENHGVVLTDWSAVDPLVYKRTIKPLLTLATSCLQCVNLIKDVFPPAKTLMLTDAESTPNQEYTQQLAVIIYVVCTNHAHTISLSVAFQCAAFLMFVDGFAESPLAVTQDAVVAIESKYGQALADLDNQLHPATQYLLQEECFQAFSDTHLNEILHELELEGPADSDSKCKNL
jgi:hypothetical protein